MIAVVLSASTHAGVGSNTSRKMGSVARQSSSTSSVSLSTQTFLGLMIGVIIFGFIIMFICVRKRPWRPIDPLLVDKPLDLIGLMPQIRGRACEEFPLNYQLPFEGAAPPQLAASDINVGAELTSGKFYMATLRGDTVVTRLVDNDTPEDNIVAYEIELMLLSLLDHPHVLRALGSSTAQLPFYYVLEYGFADGGRKHNKTGGMG